MINLKEKIIAAGIVPKEDKESNMSNFEKNIANGPRNRLGKVQVWYKWILRKSVPSNVSTRCCICGDTHAETTETERSEWAANKLRSKKIKIDTLGECQSCSS